MAKRRCVRFKRVRVRGGGMQRRCAKYSGGGTSRRRARTSGGRRRASSTRRRRKPSGMARRGSTCTRFKRVRVRGGGTQRRCAKYRP